MISLDQLAKRAGVSRAAVSHVLNGRGSKVGAEKRERILLLAEQADYKPNGLVRALRTQRTQTIGVIIPDIRFSFYPSVVNGIETAAAAKGFQVLICQSHYDPAVMAKQVELLRERRVDGLIFTPVATPPELVSRLSKSGVKMVLLDGKVDGVEVPLVDVDDRAITSLATRHLLKLGHRNIAYLAGELAESVPTAADRLKGYRASMEEAGCEAFVVSPDQEFTVEGGRDAANRLLDSGRPFSAVVAPTDMAALGLLQVFHERGVSVPDQVALVGAGNLREGEFVTPALTSVSQHANRMGEASASLLIDAIEGRTVADSSVWIEPDLVIRKSCGATKK